MNPAALALFATLATAIGSMRLWWLHAPRMESRYLLDYCRFTLGMPSSSWWPYRIEAVQHLSPAVLPDAVYGGRPLYQVLLWPLVATAVVGICSLIIAAKLEAGGNGERLISGARIVSHWQWNWPLLFRKSERGFYIETK